MVLEQSLSTIAPNGVDPPPVTEWKRVVLKHRWNAFQRALRGGLPAKAEPLRLVLELDAKSIKAQSCTYCPVKAAWLAAWMSERIGMGFVVLHAQGTWATPTMMVTKEHGGCLVGDYRVVNKQIQQVQGVKPDLEAEIDRSREVSALATLDVLQGYWHC